MEERDEWAIRAERRARDRERRKRTEAAAKARKASVEQGPRYDPGGVRFPSEAEMLARLEGHHDRGWSANAARPGIDRYAHGRGSGTHHDRKADY